MLGPGASGVLVRYPEGPEVVKGTSRSGLRPSEALSNYATQPTACAVGQQVKGHAALAHTAADGER